MLETSFWRFPSFYKLLESDLIVMKYCIGGMILLTSVHFKYRILEIIVYM